MKAIEYHAPGDIRVSSVPIPQCGDDEIRAKVDACAICGTDLKTYVHGNTRIKPPKIMGHEFTAVVETVGKNVEGFEPGQRIVMATSISCGKCFYCSKGYSNLCLDLRPMGFTYNGGMAEYITIPAQALNNGHVIRVPEGVKAEYAALAEPVSCAVNACGNSNVKQGETVLVTGAGPMGIINACVARHFGAEKIIVADTNPLRLDHAANFGFDLIVNPDTQDLRRAVLDFTGQIGADVAIIAAPAKEPQQQALDMVRKRGTICLFASLPADSSILALDSRKIHYNEITVVGSSDSTPAHVETAVELISTAQIPAEKIATHILPLEEILKGFDLMKSGQALRVVLKP
ncbi:MAG: alcohol dehydrogenase catalytic domain-containing protein [Phycisphaerae bacterium]|nr:alcohol dehydrogenase catalytic domain-containing protein [Phycisphaerae bacterium]